MNKRLCILGVTLLAAAFYGWFRLLIVTFSYDIRPGPPSKIARFTLHAPQDASWYLKECFFTSEEQLSISTLDDFCGRWKVAQHPDCIFVYQKFTTMYSINRRAGQLVIPETFQTKVLKWFGNNEELLKEAKLQFITSVFNLYTHENSIFNPLRAKRPGVLPDFENIDEYIESLLGQPQSCDFCDYKFKTAEDTFGRIESQHAVTAANTFKYDAFHSLVILKTHHPLKFTEEQFVDMFEVANKWFMKAYSTDKQYRYPHIMWDTLPKASASMIHPHAQVSLSPDRHYGLMEHIRLSALEYGMKNGGQNYFTDLIEIHNALGLATFHGEATAIAYLTPKKDYEVLVISQIYCPDFVRLLYYTIRAFFDDLQLYAWSMAVFLPKLEPYSTPNAEDIPAIARIISRGPPTSKRNDISALELFAASNVNIDPFTVIDHVRKSVSLKGRLQAADLKKIAERKERLKQEMDELEKQEVELEQQEVELKVKEEEAEANVEEDENGADEVGMEMVGNNGDQVDGGRQGDDGLPKVNPPLPNPFAQKQIQERLIENRDTSGAEKALGDGDVVDEDRDNNANVNGENIDLVDEDRDNNANVNRENIDVERRDTVRRVDWPRKRDDVVEENIENR